MLGNRFSLQGNNGLPPALQRTSNSVIVATQLAVKLLENSIKVWCIRKARAPEVTMMIVASEGKDAYHWRHLVN